MPWRQAAPSGLQCPRVGKCACGLVSSVNACTTPPGTGERPHLRGFSRSGGFSMVLLVRGQGLSPPEPHVSLFRYPYRRLPGCPTLSFGGTDAIVPPRRFVAPCQANQTSAVLHCDWASSPRASNSRVRLESDSTQPLRWVFFCSGEDHQHDRDVRVLGFVLAGEWGCANVRCWSGGPGQVSTKNRRSKAVKSAIILNYLFWII